MFVRWIGERVLGRTNYRLITVLDTEGSTGELLVREFGPLADRVDRMIVDSARDSVRTSTVAGLGISTLISLGLAFACSIVRVLSLGVAGRWCPSGVKRGRVRAVQGRDDVRALPACRGPRDASRGACPVGKARDQAIGLRT